VSRHCHDDWLFWWLLIAIAGSSPSSCSDTARQSDHTSWRDEPSRPRPVPRSRIRWNRVGAVALLGGAILTVALLPHAALVSPISASPSTFEIASEAIALAAPDDSPADAPTLAAVVAIGVPVGINPIVALPEPAVLVPTRAAWTEPLTLSDVPSSDSPGPSEAFFDVGSTREEVLAAQDAPPTYATKNGSAMWWGSSKVLFTKDGRVQSWTQGIPSLMVRK
jgi:hypothetical protein